MVAFTASKIRNKRLSAGGSFFPPMFRRRFIVPGPLSRKSGQNQKDALYFAAVLVKKKATSFLHSSV